MKSYQREFIEFMLESDVLRFGDFVTKSGRRTPYFVNTGHYDNGQRLRRLGQYYAQALMAHTGGEFDSLYGPAYKGIPLVVTTGCALAEKHDKNPGISFNRKEAKDHGEGGQLVGHSFAPGERVILVDDVVTAGTSVRESMQLLEKEADVQVTGLIVSVDRQERGTGTGSALQEISEQYGFPTFAIVSLDDILAYLKEETERGGAGLDADLLKRMQEYRAEYGVS